MSDHEEQNPETCETCERCKKDIADNDPIDLLNKQLCVSCYEVLSSQIVSAIEKGVDVYSSKKKRKDTSGSKYEALVKAAEALRHVYGEGKPVDVQIRSIAAVLDKLDQ
jgi:hypothetical protein